MSRVPQISVSDICIRNPRLYAIYTKVPIFFLPNERWKVSTCDGSARARWRWAVEGVAQHKDGTARVGPRTPSRGGGVAEGG